MHNNQSARRAPLILVAVLCAILLLAFSTRVLRAQNVDQPNPNLRELLAERDSLQQVWKGGLNLLLPPGWVPTEKQADSDTLLDLAKTARNGASDLRAVTDLLMVYDSMRSSTERAAVKPLLEDRLHLYSSQLNDDAASAAKLLGTASLQPATRKKVLDVQSGLLAAESKLIAIASSLK